MITNEEYQNALQLIKKYRKQCSNVIEEIDDVFDEKYEIRNTLISNFDFVLSVRTLNTLFNGNFNLNQFDSVVKDLAKISKKQLLRCRNFGKKSLDEIEQLCNEANIYLRP